MAKNVQEIAADHGEDFILFRFQDPLLPREGVLVHRYGCTYGGQGQSVEPEESSCSANSYHRHTR